MRCPKCNKKYYIEELEPCIWCGYDKSIEGTNGGNMAIKTILTCDNKGCKNTLELDGPYHIAKKAMKEAGWKNKKVDDAWQIICKECGNA